MSAVPNILVCAVALGLAGCGTVRAPHAIPGPWGEVNAQLYGRTVDLALDDDSEVRAARAVVVGPERVRYLADGETAVSELPTARLVRITAGSDRDRERGALLGALPGAAVLALNGAANGNSRPAVELGGVALVAAGAVLGWRLGRGRERSEVLYERRAAAP